MGTLNRRIQDLTDSLFDDDRGVNKRGFYPGQEEAERKQAEKLWELSKFTDKELNEELTRRIIEPVTEALNQLNIALEALNGYDAEHPF